MKGLFTLNVLLPLSLCLHGLAQTLESNKNSNISTNRFQSLVSAFDLNPANARFRPKNVITFDALASSTTKNFQAQSSVLYLQPPRPRHIASIHNELLDMTLEPQAKGENRLTIIWRLVVHLRDAHHRSHRDRREAANQTATIEAKVEHESTPIKYTIYIRAYGQTERSEFHFTDHNNTLEPPITVNETYRYDVPQSIRARAGYEICLRSHNSGHFQQSSEFESRFPLNAMATSIAGQRNNPQFICKEVALEPSQDLEVEIVNNRLKESGRSLGGDAGGGVELDENQAAEAFVLYTAITSGSTSVFLLIILVVFCCCRCRRDKQTYPHSSSREAIRYDRANTTFAND